MPNTHKGVDEETLVKVFNLFDTYIQPAICEGWSLPIVESKACGVPGLYQNYSAMEDHVENGGGLPIKIKRLYHEAETGAIRSLPDIDDLVAKMGRFALDNKLRTRLGKEARECAEKIHNWDITIKDYERIFDSVDLFDRDDTWDSKPEFKVLSTKNPQYQMTAEDFIHWCYVNILHRMPDEDGMSTWLDKLQKGMKPEQIQQHFRDMIVADNKFEEIRWQNSLKRRGIKLPVDTTTFTTDFVPGALI